MEEKFVSEYPRLLSEWNTQKNGSLGLLPNHTTFKSNQKVWWKCSRGHEWQAVVSQRSSGVGCPVCANKKVLAGYNDLATTYPQLAVEWNYQRNGDLLPTEVTGGCGKRVWWICGKGHEWCTTPNKRTSDMTGCPFCSNKKVLAGYNDIQTTHPQLMRQWNYKKNTDVFPSSITAGSGRSVWWVCSKGHEWKASPCNRIKHRECPVCSKQYSTSRPEQALFYYIRQFFPDVINGDLNAIGMELDLYIPSLKTAIEYDGIYYHQSGDIKIREEKKNYECKQKGIRLIRVREDGLTTYSDCECIVRKNPEDFLSMDIVISCVLEMLGINDFAIHIEQDYQKILESFMVNEVAGSLEKVFPRLATEWNFEKNGQLNPSMLQANSSSIVWWKCEKGHEWQASLHNRGKGKGCPYCSGRVPVLGESDLLTVYPNIAEEWNYNRNGDLSPNQITSKSDRTVWWICKRGHEWQTKVITRAKGNNCPYCSNKKVLKGFNDLLTTHPLLAEEWNYSKNGSKGPDEFVAGSGKKVWWKCKEGHEWQAVIGLRATGVGCPYCAGNGKRTVINKDTGEIFSSFSEAAKRYKGTITPISNCCKGLQATALGYHWGFLDER